MVTVKKISLKKGKDGKPFVALELQGDMEFVQSMGTGRFYATAKKCSISSTFDEATAKTLIGKQMPGTIQRVEAEPYEYTVPETGEVILLQHTYTYVPELKNAPPSRALEAV